MLRQRSLTPLVEMARWKNAGHAAAAFSILGYLAGLSDQEISADWNHGDQERVIQAVLRH